MSSLPSLSIEGALLSWYEAKMFLEHALSVSPDALHVIVGAVLFLLGAILFRQTLSSWRVWLALLFVNVFNEFVDLWVERWPDPARQYGQGMKDLILTMTIPTILILVVRLAPRLLVRQPDVPEELEG